MKRCCAWCKQARSLATQSCVDLRQSNSGKLRVACLALRILWEVVINVARRWSDAWARSLHRSVANAARTSARISIEIGTGFLISIHYRMILPLIRRNIASRAG